MCGRMAQNGFSNAVFWSDLSLSFLPLCEVNHPNKFACSQPIHKDLEGFPTWTFHVSPPYIFDLKTRITMVNLLQLIGAHAKCFLSVTVGTAHAVPVRQNHYTSLSEAKTRLLRGSVAGFDSELRSIKDHGFKIWERNCEGCTDKGVEAEPLSSFMRQYFLDKVWVMFFTLVCKKCNYKIPKVEIADTEKSR